MNRVIISRHVRFDENIFPYSSPSSPTSTSPPDTNLTEEFDPPPPDLLLQPAVPPTPSPTADSDTSPPPRHPTPAPSSSSPTRVSSSSETSSSSKSSALRSPPSFPPTPPPAPPSLHPMVTRARVGTYKPRQRLNLTASAPLSDISPVPRSYSQALRDPNWKAAMETELHALHSNGTLEVVPCPPDTNLVGSKWIFRHKFRSDGSLERYKARLVAQGFTQRPGIDYDDTFSPVVKPATIRTVLSLALSRSWPIHQLDVKNAFLHGHLSETVYMKQPPDFSDPSSPHLVCRLQRALYGLKQAPRAWHHYFASYVSTLGFIRSKADASLFTFHKGNDTAYLLLYVDDIVLTASSSSLLSLITTRVSSEFAMTDLGALHCFLGISVTRTSSGLFLSQEKFAREILDRAGMLACNPVSTPVDTHSKLSVSAGPPFLILLSIAVSPVLFST